MVKYFNCQPGEQLGKFVGYRVAFVPTLASIFNSTSDLVAAYARISATGLVRRASSSELSPGDNVLVVDLLPTTEGQTRTLAMLANSLHDSANRGSLIPVVKVYSIERIEEQDIPGQSGIDARTAYKQAIGTIREKESILPKLTGGFGQLKWLLSALIAIALLFVLWKFVAVVRAK